MSLVNRAAVIALFCASVCVAAHAEEGFQSLFDGKSLAGWKAGDASYWSIEEGAITGRITPEHPCKANQYLVWRREVADFELKLKSRVNGAGSINNGFQFRSRLLKDGDVCGYQVDNNLQTPWQVRLYDEFGRHTLAWRGERATIDADGKLSIAKIAEAAGPAWFKLEEWHEYHLTCIGSRISLRIDGRLAAEAEDGDPRRREISGILALQLHSGPPTVAQFKDIRLKEISPPPSRLLGRTGHRCVPILCRAPSPIGHSTKQAMDSNRRCGMCRRGRSLR